MLPWRLGGDVVGGADGAEVEGGGGFADGLVGLGVLREGDEGAVGAEDAGLFAGDLGDGVAEVVLWSRAMSVMTERRGSTMLVASRRPPRPTSRTAMSTFCSAK